MTAIAKITSKGQTTTKNRPVLDCAIEDWGRAGLPAPSAVRFKLFMLDPRWVRGELGRLGAMDQTAIHLAMHQLQGGTT